MKQGETVSIPGGATVEFLSTTMRFAEGEPIVLEFLLTLARSVTASVIAKWFCEKFKKSEKLKGNVPSLKIDRKIVEIEEGEITKIIEEHIEFRN